MSAQDVLSESHCTVCYRLWYLPDECAIRQGEDAVSVGARDKSCHLGQMLIGLRSSNRCAIDKTLLACPPQQGWHAFFSISLPNPRLPSPGIAMGEVWPRPLDGAAGGPSQPSLPSSDSAPCTSLACRAAEKGSVPASFQAPASVTLLRP